MRGLLHRELREMTILTVLLLRFPIAFRTSINEMEACLPHSIITPVVIPTICSEKCRFLSSSSVIYHDDGLQLMRIHRFGFREDLRALLRNIVKVLSVICKYN